MSRFRHFELWREYIKVNHENLQESFKITELLLQKLHTADIITYETYSEIQSIHSDVIRFIRFFDHMYNSPDWFATKYTLTLLATVAIEFKYTAATGIFQKFLHEHKDNLPDGGPCYNLKGSLNNPPGLIKNFNFKLLPPKPISDFHRIIRNNLVESISEALDFIDEDGFQEPQMVVIAGMPKIGKTTLIKEYVKLHKKRTNTYQNLVWINASNDRILYWDFKMLLRFLKRMNTSTNDQDKGAAELANQCFPLLNNYMSLIVFYNVRNGTILENVIPTDFIYPNLHFIVTTESRDWSISNNLGLARFHLTVLQENSNQKKMLRNAAANYLVNRLKGLNCSTAEATQLAQRMGLHVEALECVCRRLEIWNSLLGAPVPPEDLYTISDLLASMEEFATSSPPLVLQNNPIDLHHILLRDISEIFAPSLEKLALGQIGDEVTSAVRVLRFLVLLQRRKVPYSAAKLLCFADPQTSIKAINLLCNSSLAITTEVENRDTVFKVHPLVQDAVSSRFIPSEVIEEFTRNIPTLKEHFSDIPPCYF